MNKKQLKHKLKEMTKNCNASRNENIDMLSRMAILHNNLNALELSNNNLVKENNMLKSDIREADTYLQSAESALNYKEIRENDNAEFLAKILRSYNDR